MAVFMHRVALQPIHSQSGEAFEIAIERAKDCTVLDGDGGQMCVADQVAALTRTCQQAPEEGCMSIGRADNARARVREPFIHHSQCRFKRQGGCNEAPLSAQPQEPRQCVPCKCNTCRIGERIFQPASGGGTLWCVKIDRVHEDVDVRRFHFGGSHPRSMSSSSSASANAFVKSTSGLPM